MDERKLGAILSLDPAYAAKSNSGIAVRKADGTNLSAYEGSVFDPDCYSWVLAALSACLAPTERVLFVAERDAYGSHSVARGLGTAIGAVEGLLIDIGAIAPYSRVDVSSKHWRPEEIANLPRAKFGVKVAEQRERRKTIKAAAVALVKKRHGLTLGPDGAEAVLINDWALEKYT